MNLISQMFCKHRKLNYLCTRNVGDTGTEYYYCEDCNKLIEKKHVVHSIMAIRTNNVNQFEVRMHDNELMLLKNALRNYKLDLNNVIELLVSHFINEVDEYNKSMSEYSTEIDKCLSELSRLNTLIEELRSINTSNSNYLHDQNNVDLYVKINAAVTNLSKIDFSHMFNMGVDESMAFTDVESKLINTIIQQVKGYDWMYDRLMWDKSGDNVVIYRKRVNRRKK